jgi:hypothetical protein
VDGGRGIGVVGSDQRGGSKGFNDPFDIGEYNGSNAANALGKHDGSNAANALGKYDGTDAANALEHVIRASPKAGGW